MMKQPYARFSNTLRVFMGKPMHNISFLSEIATLKTSLAKRLLQKLS